MPFKCSFVHMSSIRQQKVSALIQRELSNYFLVHARSRYFGAMVSVTTVRVTPDLGVAKVYLSIFGGNEPREKVFSAVEQTAKEIRTAFARETKSQLRITPEFIYFIDDSMDYAEEINRLLKKK